ncbi:MAG: DUF1211 domain-containing protein [Chloroflexi bacterium]|nr:MAG: DUF1211 domain-containing protein [Chloroflexota bacterium]
MTRGRLEAFSDGIFAVAITLLALNLGVEGPGHGPLLQQLGDRSTTSSWSRARCSSSTCSSCFSLSRSRLQPA